MVDNLPAIVGIPLAAILWGAYLLMVVRSRG